jgi:hypothetical protein
MHLPARATGRVHRPSGPLVELSCRAAKTHSPLGALLERPDWNRFFWVILRLSGSAAEAVGIPRVIPPFSEENHT